MTACSSVTQCSLGRGQQDADEVSNPHQMTPLVDWGPSGFWRETLFLFFLAAMRWLALLLSAVSFWFSTDRNSETQWPPTETLRRNRSFLLWLLSPDTWSQGMQKPINTPCNRTQLSMRERKMSRTSRPLFPAIGGVSHAVSRLERTQAQPYRLPKTH